MTDVLFLPQSPERHLYVLRTGCCELTENVSTQWQCLLLLPQVMLGWGMGTVEPGVGILRAAASAIAASERRGD